MEWNRTTKELVFDAWRVEVVGVEDDGGEESWGSAGDVRHFFEHTLNV